MSSCRPGAARSSIAALRSFADAAGEAPEQGLGTGVGLMSALAPSCPRWPPYGPVPRRVRTAPYPRKWLVLGTLIGVVAGLGAVVFYDGLKAGRAPYWRLTRPPRPPARAAFHLASGRPPALGDPPRCRRRRPGRRVARLRPGARGRRPRDRCPHQGRAHQPQSGVRPRVIVVKLTGVEAPLSARAAQGAEKAPCWASNCFTCYDVEIKARLPVWS